MSQERVEPAEIAASWSRANHTALAAELAEIRARIERYLSDEPKASQESRAQLRLVDENGHTVPSSLDALCRLFDLSELERAIVLLCLGMEVDSGFSDLCARAHGKDEMRYPTFWLAMKIFGDSDWSVCSPHGTLRHWNIIEVTPGKGRIFQPISLDERILDYLLDHRGIDIRLAGVIKPVAAIADELNISPLQNEVIDGLVRALAQPQASRPAVAHLCGMDVVQSRAMTALAGRRLGCNVHVVALESLPRDSASLDQVLRLWHREAILSQSVLLIEHAQPGGVSAALSPGLGQVLDRLDVPVVVSGPALQPSRERQIVRLDVPDAHTPERPEPWFSGLIGGGEKSAALPPLPGLGLTA